MVQGLSAADGPQHIEAVGLARWTGARIGEPDVQQHRLKARIAQQRQRFGSRAGRGDGVVLFREDGLQRLANIGLIVDDQNVVQEWTST
jgi:hypothetical protein